MKSILLQNLFFGLLGMAAIVLMSAQIQSPPSYAQASDRIILFGQWSRTADARAKQGVVASSSHPGSYMTLQVTDDSFTLFRRMGPNGGRMQVTIDGKNYGILEFYFFEERWSVPAYFDKLGPGQHQIVLTINNNKNSSSSGTMVAIEVVQVPTVLLPTSLQQVAIEHANRYRTQAGVPPVQMSMALNVTAQNHADFYTTSWTAGCIADYPPEHYECPPSAPGYTGYAPWDRGYYAGYTGLAVENLTLASDPYVAVDWWISAPYHRNPILQYSYTEMGYGSSVDKSEVGTLLFGTRAFEQPAPASRLIYTYPADGQTQVPLSWSGGEKPDPLPGKPLPVGSAISLYIAQPKLAGTTPPSQWAISSATLRNEQNQAVPLYVLYQGVDPNTKRPDIIHLFPQAPMAVDTIYNARVVGTDSRGIPFDHSWSFTTATGSSIVDLSSRVGASGAIVRWATPSSTTGVVEYGLTKNYGQSVNQALSWVYAGASYAQAHLMGLHPNTTYHYRVVAQDANGTHTSADRIFVTGSKPKTIHVPADAPNLAMAAGQALPGDTIALAAGNYAVNNNISLTAGAHLVGAGADQTTLELAVGIWFSIAGNSVVTGIHFVGTGTAVDGGIDVDEGSSPIFWKNRVSQFKYGISSGGNTLIAQNLLFHNSIGVNVYNGTSRIINNTIADGAYGVYLDTSQNSLYNNAITAQDYGILTYEPQQTQQYNAFWNNNINIWGTADGAGTVTSNPRFVNPSSNNYTLQANSPLRNAGHPNTGYNDSDNTRNDIGATGSPRFVKQLADPLLNPEPVEPPPVTPIDSVWLLPPITIQPLPATPTRTSAPATPTSTSAPATPTSTSAPATPTHTSAPTHTPRPQQKALLFLPFVAK